ncbi:MAG: 4-azaleucine resistance transporter AzlC [Chlamydiales bacterium]|jgi:4-azaleucine resistance transporter AzlC
MSSEAHSIPTELQATSSNSTFLNALKCSLPIFFAYIPFGFTCGFLFQRLGYDVFVGPLMSLFVLAGSAQILAITLIAAQASIIDIALTTFLINLRHIFYGLSLLERYQCGKLKKLYMIFGLTDETYSLLTSSPPLEKSQDPNHCFYVTALIHSYWMMGSILGAYCGANLSPDIPGIEFVPTAIFVILTIEQAANVQTFTPFIIALVAALISLIFFPKNMLFIAITISAGMLIAHKTWETKKICN